MKKYVILLIIIMYSILPCLGNTYIKYEKIDSLINDISWKSIISNFNYITTFDVRKQLKNRAQLQKSVDRCQPTTQRFWLP